MRHGTAFGKLCDFVRSSIGDDIVLLEHPTSRIAYYLVTGRCDTSTSISPRPLGVRSSGIALAIRQREV